MTATPLFIVLAAAAMTGTGAASSPELLCLVMDNTRSIRPCVISEAEHRVTVDVDLRGEDGAAFCSKIQASLAKQRILFDDGPWSLDITTPASGGKPVASCALPRSGE